MLSRPANALLQTVSLFCSPSIFRYLSLLIVTICWFLPLVQANKFRTFRFTLRKQDVRETVSSTGKDASTSGTLSSLSNQLQLHGEEVEATLTSTLNILVFAGLAGWKAQSLNRIDLKRRQVEQKLQQANVNPEQLVTELQKTNNRLQRELLRRERVERKLQESAASLRSLYIQMPIGRNRLLGITAS